MKRRKQNISVFRFLESGIETAQKWRAIKEEQLFKKKIWEKGMEWKQEIGEFREIEKYSKLKDFLCET